MSDDMSDAFVSWLVIWSGGYEEPCYEAYPGGGSFKDALRRGREFAADSGLHEAYVDVIGIEFTGEIGWHERVTKTGTDEFNVDKLVDRRLA